MAEGSSPNPTSKPQYTRAARQPSEKPRRVRGGVRLTTKEWPPPLNQAASHWIELMRQLIDEDHMVEGLEYAKDGQTRRLDVQLAKIEGVVQGRMPRAYQCSVELPAHPTEAWDRIVALVAEQAIYAAKLLAGEIPPAFEETLVEAGVPLMTVDPASFIGSCTCGHTDGMCKHIACLALLVCEALHKDPFLIFRLRGLPSEEFLERLRQQRALVSASGGRARAYEHQASPGAETRAPALDECLDRFWDAGPELDQIETRLSRPEVSNALLRRLGPSPFDGRFPLVGLLATCYETISNAVLTKQPDELDEDDDSDQSLDDDR